MGAAFLRRLYEETGNPNRNRNGSKKKTPNGPRYRGPRASGKVGQKAAPWFSANQTAKKICTKTGAECYPPGPP